jgi:hypothetical protein
MTRVPGCGYRVAGSGYRVKGTGFGVPSSYRHPVPGTLYPFNEVQR